MRLIHGTAVSVAGRGLLITGSSGAGKSGLALTLMARGAILVADDQVQVQSDKGLFLCTVPRLAGKIEARNIGILEGEYIDKAPLAFIVDMDMAPVSRMPAPSFTEFYGQKIRHIAGRNVANLDATLYLLLKNFKFLQ